MLDDRIREIREELNAFEDEFLRYSFLVELSSYVPADQPELMKDENLHRGCQSRVWLRCRLQEVLTTSWALLRSSCVSIRPTSPIMDR